MYKFGNIPTKVEVLFEFENGRNELICKSANVWENGTDQILIKFDTTQKVKKVILGNKHIPDVKLDNNSL